MRDPRLNKLAGIMLDHSIKVQPGEWFQISSETCGMPLVKAILEETKKRQGLAHVVLSNQELSRLVLGLYNPDDDNVKAFLKDKTEIGLRRYENLIGDIVIRAYENDQELSGIPPKVLQLTSAQGKPLQDLVVNNRRWVLFEYPTPGQAQRLGLSYDDYYDFVLDVACVDYQAMQKNADILKSVFEKTDKVRITSPGTDLSFSIKGMTAIPCAGENNIPDGECFCAPVKNSVNGHITYNAPSNYWGKTFTNIRFDFMDGQIVKATCDQDDTVLGQILDSDEGARYIGEFALGFNPLIKEPFQNTLFDEKICGSLHFTPGACYDESPNGNKSTIHWDLVLIQREDHGGGEIWFDDQLIRKDGLFTIPELEPLNP